VLDALDDVDALLLNDVAEVHCTRFAAGNVALVGDAAHAMTPNLGQGANSALVDVAVLGHALTSHDVVEIALGAYDERRRAPVQRVQRTARTLLRLSNAHGAAYSRVRDALLRASSPIAARSAARTFRTVLQEQPQWLAETTAAVSGQPAASGAG
jgi:2-polyprenyl-6-methoxyphenol hydroxylase-like FAD-dependent oxidoreductase